MTFPLANRQFEYITPPRAFGPTGPVGQVAAFVVSSAGAVVDLSKLLFGLPYDVSRASSAQINGVVGSYITIEADGADLGVITGPTQGSVSSTTGLPALGVVGAMSGSGTYTQATGTCFRIPNTTSIHVLPQVGQDTFLGLCAPSGLTGIARIYQSSPANP
jgi:hypothetical protein